MIDFFPSRAVAIDLFGFSVHWYGLLYFAAFLIGWFLIGKLQKYRSLNLTAEELSSILTATVIGVILGGRLGYILFYNPWYYVANPADILAVWKGGMASHGGFIGVAVALLYVLRKKSKEEILRIADIVVIPVAIGLGLGRIGNFINQELYGTVTTLPWGVAFAGVDGLRHPVQLYDFLLQMIIAGLCFLHLRRTQTPGRTLALFLLLYGVVRFALEFIKEHDGNIFWGLSEGQILTIPLLLIALVLWWKTSKRSANN